ncbi:BEN domain-containing protein 2 [Physeter macrocephalus]|uniref:BEN domain-containing protein 2 n=1 Tax=Physeter macrocephalus TaxID=9755 RepID=A0A455B3S5_PHYMC|nr:BEN domain-containing protein 2 [Physeter catodon]|eukprot:XP_028338686.1 BEN domain-containing protein 2 [Physeter catodon]
MASRRLEVIWGLQRGAGFMASQGLERILRLEVSAEFMVSWGMEGILGLSAYVTVTIEEDSDDADVVIVDDSDAEVTENTVSSDDMLTIQPDFEGDNDTSEEPSQLSYGVEGLAELGDQAVSQMNRLANLRRHGAYSAETEFIPLCKKSRSCIPGEDNMDSMGDGSPSLPVERQEDNAGTNPVGTSLQSAALPELQQPVLRESPPLPRIVSTYSLEPCFTPRSPSLGLPVLSSYLSEGAKSTNSVVSSAQATVAVPVAVLPQGEPSLADTSETVNYSTIMGNNSMGPDTALPFLCIPPNTEVSGKAETSLGNSTESRYYPTFLGNDSGQDTASSSIFIPPSFAFEKVILTEMPGKAETSVENSSQTMYYPTLVGNESGPDAASSTLSIPPNFESGREMGCEEMNYPTVQENDSDEDTDSENSFLTAGLEILEKAESSLKDYTQMKYPVLLDGDSEILEKAESSLKDYTQMKYPVLLDGDSEILEKAESSLKDYTQMKYPVLLDGDSESGTEMGCETMNYPTVQEDDSDEDTDSENSFPNPGFEKSPETANFPLLLENSSSQDISSLCHCIPPSFGYLGDPRRNVRMLDIHLMIAQKEAKPKHAARYLVRILFSKEIMIASSVAVNSQGHQPLDPNKMAAIREHLAAVFPNHDLRECGKDWQDCISDINSLICYLCSQRTPKTVNNNIEPTNPDTDSKDKRDGDDSESSSLLSQQAAGSETRENGNSQQNSSALPEGIKEPSTDNSTVSYETLEYLGNPCRNIQMPKSVLNIAKAKSLPELSARYLIRNLFTEEVLIKSNVSGTLGRGTYILNANKMNALREFLQDIYPTYDLSETGYDWELCVTAINSCIRSLRYDHRKSTSKSQPPPATTPSTESEPRDTGLAD